MSETHASAPGAPDAEAVAEKLADALEPTPERRAELRADAERMAVAIMAADPSDAASRRAARADVERLGAQAGARPGPRGRLTASTLAELAARGTDGGIADHLDALAARMRRLDPSGVNFARTGVLGRLLDPADRYFARLADERGEIEGAMLALKHDRDTLAADDVELRRQEAELVDEARALAEAIELADRLEEELVRAVARSEASGGEEGRLRFVRGEVLGPLERRRQELRELLVVSQQTAIAIAVLHDGNRALVARIDHISRLSLHALDLGVAAQRSLARCRASRHLMTDSDGNAVPDADPEAIRDSFEQVFSALEADAAGRAATASLVQGVIADLRAISAEGTGSSGQHAGTAGT